MNTHPNEENSVLSVEPSVKAEKIAALLRVCTRQVRKLAKQGVIPSARLGGARRFNLADVKRTLGIRGDTLWEIKDVAANLAVSERHVHNLICQGLIPRIKLLGALRFDPIAIQEAKLRLTIHVREWADPV